MVDAAIAQRALSPLTYAQLSTLAVQTLGADAFEAGQPTRSWLGSFLRRYPDASKRKRRRPINTRQQGVIRGIKSSARPNAATYGRVVEHTDIVNARDVSLQDTSCLWSGPFAALATQSGPASSSAPSSASSSVPRTNSLVAVALSESALSSNVADPKEQRGVTPPAMLTLAEQLAGMKQDIHERGLNVLNSTVAEDIDADLPMVHRDDADVPKPDVLPSVGLPQGNTKAQVSARIERLKQDVAQKAHEAEQFRRKLAEAHDCEMQLKRDLEADLLRSRLGDIYSVLQSPLVTLIETQGEATDHLPEKRPRTQPGWLFLTDASNISVASSSSLEPRRSIPGVDPEGGPVSIGYAAVTRKPFEDLLAMMNTTAVPLNHASVFVDIGSGVGNCLFHVQTTVRPAITIGIETCQGRVLESIRLHELFKKRRLLHPPLSSEAAQQNVNTTVALLAKHCCVDDSRISMPVDEHTGIGIIEGSAAAHEKYQSLLTQVYCFDAVFTDESRQGILPNVCIHPPSRIVVTCSSLDDLGRIEGRNGHSLKEYVELVNQLSLRTNGKFERLVYVYQTKTIDDSETIEWSDGVVRPAADQPAAGSSTSQ